MPKMFGSVVLGNIPGHVICNNCGYTWNDPKALDTIAGGRKVNCPICRLFRGIDLNKPLREDSSVFISPSLLKMSYPSFAESKYMSQGIPLLCKKCNKKWLVKYSDLKEYISKGAKCRFCDATRPTNTPDTLQRSDTTQPSKVIEQEKEADKISLAGYSPLEKMLAKCIGQSINKSVIIKELDRTNQEFLVQCVTCGMERKLPLRYIADKETRSKEIRCIRCSNSKKKLTVDDLKVKYLGKIYNGLKITDIYENDRGFISCSVQCTEGTKYIPNGDIVIEKPGHLDKDIPIGDVINSHAFCRICAKSSIFRVERLMGAIDCIDFKRSMNKSVKFGYNDSSAGGLTCREVYTTDGNICDKCPKKDSCTVLYKGYPNMQYSYIRGIADIKDRQTAAFRDVRDKYPNICAGAVGGIRQYRALPEAGLIILRDAYRGRDKERQLYKFCKCTEHGTEMVLSESEINEFNHMQCTGDKNPNMRFYDIGEVYLLGKAEKEK